MCGIVAGVSRKKVMPILLEGLRRLEYRGYDSCGVAVIEGGAIRRARSVKRVQELVEQVEAEKLGSTVGIAHTRWATHGGPVVCNAHPHIAGGRIALVHNGIIENYAEIREELLSAGVTFESQTDTEVLAHLVNHYYEGDLLAAVERSLNRVRGAYGIAVMALDEPERIVAARLGSPMVVGLADEGNFIASDAMAMAGENVPAEVYDNLVATVRKHIPAMHRYVRLRKKMLGVDALHFYDVYAPLVGDL